MAQYCIGIDLGTTNSVLAFAPIEESDPLVAVLPIPQLVAPGAVERRLALPSFLYLHSNRNDASLKVPGIRQTRGVTGEYARRVACEQPEFVVAAAKSWLCNDNVDRQSAILPWGTEESASRVSPVEATTIYLEHLIDAWHSEFPDAPFAEQQVALTVPASFDLDAKELTRQAALDAGFPHDFVFLEEPQAALYNWIHAHGKNWRQTLREGDVILVCDVGGGTTDLTLVRIQNENGKLSMHRLAVGDHLLIGGDNMDLALAHVASQKFGAIGTKLNAWQSVSLWHSCRLAKETLLRSAKAPETYPLSILGRGSKLIGGTISIELDRSTVSEVLVDGFFPKVSKEDRPHREASSGFQEVGLPFEHDTAITRHVAGFIAEQLAKKDENPEVLSHVLFNGGVFNATVFRDRFVETIASWNAHGKPPAVLGEVEDLDQAVACGACYYVWSKKHGGVRIRGGAARSYYVGIETSGPSIPGMPRPLQALCVVPQGMEEGSQTDIVSRDVGIKVGQPARFRFFSSTHRKQDRPGTYLRTWDEDELHETSPLEIELPAKEGEQVIPVRFQSRITELGMLELWCKSTHGDQSWKLEFNVRE